MRIGIDGLPLTQTLTGIGHYTNQLAIHLALEADGDEIEVISPRAFLPDLDTSAERPPNLHFSRARLSPLNRRWWSIGLPRYLRRHPIEVFHGTNFEVPLQQVCPTVLTIHDLSMWLHPETQEKKLVRRAHRRLPAMVKAATMIITPTESVRLEVNEHLGIPLERIAAVPEAARGCFRPVDAAQSAATRKRLGIADEFLLFVGTVEPRKNLTTLLHTFEAILSRRQQPLQLVVAGRRGWLVDDLLELMKRSPNAHRIKLTGYLSDEDLCALYSSCAAFIYPSIYEGFGLPPLEAMACGAPVVASDIPAIREVVNTAAQLVSPESVPELTHALLELLVSAQARRKLSAAGIKRAAEFSWSGAAAATRAVFVEAGRRYRSA